VETVETRVVGYMLACSSGCGRLKAGPLLKQTVQCKLCAVR
jgi:hypothetical protein